MRSAFREFTAQNVTVDFFIASLANLSIEHMELHKDFLEKISSDISKESTLGMVWVKLATYWNFLNYFLLEQVVCEFGDQILNDSIQEYKRSLRDFRRNTRLCDFAKYSSKVSTNISEKDFSLLAKKLDQSWEECTLEDNGKPSRRD